MKPYFPVALDLTGEPVLVVGGDAEASDKASRLACARARVTVVSPEGDEALQELARRGEVAWCARELDEERDLPGNRLVVLTAQDAALAARLQARGRSEGYWLCAIDQPEHCDWVNMGIVEAGPIRVAISSGGAAPGLVKRLRQGLQTVLDTRFVRFAERFVRYRNTLLDHDAAERRRLLERALEGFQLQGRIDYPVWTREKQDADP